MLRFRIQFEAIRKGAIGSREEYVRTVKADNEKEAIASLYKEFEHIHVKHIGSE